MDFVHVHSQSYGGGRQINPPIPPTSYPLSRLNPPFHTIMDIIDTHSQSYGGCRSATPIPCIMGIAHAHFLGRFAPFAVQKTLEEQNTPRCCCFAFACSGRRRSWATTTLDLLSPSVVMAQTAWSKRWIKPEASLPSQLSGSPFFPLLFFARKKKHKISFRTSSGFSICVADQGVLVCLSSADAVVFLS